VRFLHRELGFDVLAFESGSYDCWKAWQRIEAGEDPDAAFRESVFPIWTRSAQIQPLIDYFSSVARTERPLILAGIDSQFTGEMSDRFLLEDLVRIAEAVGAPADRLAETIAGPLANLVEARYEGGEVPEPAARSAFLEALADLEGRLRREGERVPDRAFWLRLLESTRDSAATFWSARHDRALIESPEDYAVRDRLMGEQIVWLARNGFPGHKIVVWMHSLHAARGLRGVEVPPSKPVHVRLFHTLEPAGHVARAALGDDLYTMAFLAYQGRYATVFADRPIELWKPTAGSLEDLFHRTGRAFAFLDLSHRSDLAPWLRDRTIARPMGFMEMRARWREVFDGVLFLDRMEVSQAVGSVGPKTSSASRRRRPTDAGGRRSGATAAGRQGIPVAAGDELHGVLARQGWREEKPLSLLAADLTQHGGLVVGLDSLGHDVHLEVSGERDDGPHHRAVSALFSQALHERAIDLQKVDGEALEIA
jgi:erythromycin esterase